MKHLLFLHGFLGAHSDWNGVLSAFKHSYTTSFGDAKSADVVIGYSMGGRRALSLYPHLSAKKLILIASHPGLEREDEKKKRSDFEKKWLSILDQEPLETFLKKWYREPLFSGLKEIPKERFSLSKAEIRQDFLTFSLTKQPSFWHTIDIPFLYIAGEKDLKYTNIGRKLGALYPKSEIAIIPNASHAVHLENPNEVANLIETFIHRNHHD